MTHLPGADFPIDGRLRLFAALLGAVFAIFELRLFQLQVVEAEELRERALRNSARTVRLDAPRGEIVDREGRTLADTRSRHAQRPAGSGAHLRGSGAAGRRRRCRAC
jgi:hypothetical protein